jgi:hypothetical protein
MIDVDELRAMLDPFVGVLPHGTQPPAEPSSPGGSVYVNDGNLKLVRTMPCILHGHFGCDPCHYPTRRSQGRDDSLLNLLPICRTWHNRLDLYDADAIKSVESVAMYHWRWVLRTYGDLPSHRLGTPERIMEVQIWKDRLTPQQSRG